MQKNYRRIPVLALASLIALLSITFAPESQASGVGPGSSSPTPATRAQTQENVNTDIPYRKVSGAYRMPDGSAIEGVLARGIDVSHWKQSIDWKAVAADDITFAMLGTRYKGEVDPYFHKNAKEASAAGIKLGAYIYSYALNEEMAIAEADFVLDLVKDYPFSMPIAFDVEDSVQESMSKQELSGLVNAFCKRIADAGYYPMVYANDHWLANKLDMSVINHDVWAARYGKRPVYSGYTMWQATSTGTVNGVSGNVDINFLYRDYSTVVPANNWREIGGKRYYFKNHAMQKNAWIHDGDGWYYMDANGEAEVGWLKMTEGTYYLDPTSNGKMMTGWIQFGTKWHYFKSSGRMAVGWVQEQGNWYYTDADGVMQTSWLQQGADHYYLEPSGAMSIGWRHLNDQWYYFKPSGLRLSGWLQDKDSWYYMDSNGIMKTDWITVGDTRYHLKPSGAMNTGWIQPDGNWYYLDTASGKMKTGMLELDGKKYYLNTTTGQMLVNTQILIDNITYDINADGVCTPLNQAPASSAESTAETEAAGTPYGMEPTKPQASETAGNRDVQLGVGPGM